MEEVKYKAGVQTLTSELSPRACCIGSAIGGAPMGALVATALYFLLEAALAEGIA